MKNQCLAPQFNRNWVMLCFRYVIVDDACEPLLQRTVGTV